MLAAGRERMYTLPQRARFSSSTLNNSSAGKFPASVFVWRERNKLYASYKGTMIRDSNRLCRRALSFLVLPCLLPISWFFVCVSHLYWIQCLSGTCMNTACGLRVYYCMWDEMSSRIVMCWYHNIIEIWRCAFWVGPKGEPARNAQATPQNTLATTQHLKIHTIATAEQCPGNHPEHLGILAETFARTDLTHFSFKHAFIFLLVPHWTVHWWTD